MKTEDFDDAIRRKFQSINNTHDQKDVQFVHDYVLNQMSNTSKKRNRFVILFAGGILLIGSLFTWNLYQLKEIEALKQQIGKLNVKTGEDLIYLKNEKSKTVSETTKKSVSTADILPDSIQIVKKYASNDNVTTSNNEVARGRKATYAAVNIDISGYSDSEKQNLAALKEKTDDSITILDNARLATENGVTTSSNINETPELKTDTIASGSPYITQSTMTDSLDFKNLGNDSLTIDRSAESPSLEKTWNYRAGIGVEGGNSQLGFGILGEAVFKKKIAISAGIKLLKNGVETFDDDDDYDDHKHKGFKNTYGSKIDGDSKNIRIRNTLFQIPLTLSYIFPIKSNFSILAGIGTDVDIYTKQHIEYHHVNLSNDLQTTQFVTNYPSAYFNNVVIMAGIQKKIKRFVFHLSPYISPQLKRVDYKKEDCYFGLRLRTFFEF